MVLENKKITLLNFFKKKDPMAVELSNLLELEFSKDWLTKYFDLDDKFTQELTFGLDSFTEKEIYFVLIQHNEWKNNYLCDEVAKLFTLDAA